MSTLKFNIIGQICSLQNRGLTLGRFASYKIEVLYLLALAAIEGEKPVCMPSSMGNSLTPVLCRCSNNSISLNIDSHVILSHLCSVFVRGAPRLITFIQGEITTSAIRSDSQEATNYDEFYCSKACSLKII